MDKRKRALWAILAPFCLGIVVALAFLAHYLKRNRAVVTVINSSGMDVMGGTVRVSSENQGLEIGPINAGDSASVIFRNVSDGHFAWSIDLKSGVRLADSAGYVTHGRDFRDRLVIETVDGVPRIRLDAD